MRADACSGRHVCSGRAGRRLLGQKPPAAGARADVCSGRNPQQRARAARADAFLALAYQWRCSSCAIHIRGGLGWQTHVRIQQMYLCKSNISASKSNIEISIVQTHLELELAFSSGNSYCRFAKHLHMPMCGVRKHPFFIFRVQSHLSEDGAPSRAEPTKQLITVNGTTNG